MAADELDAPAEHLSKQAFGNSRFLRVLLHLDGTELIVSRQSLASELGIKVQIVGPVVDRMLQLEILKPGVRHGRSLSYVVNSAELAPWLQLAKHLRTKADWRMSVEVEQYWELARSELEPANYDALRRLAQQLEAGDVVGYVATSLSRLTGMSEDEIHADIARKAENA